MARRSLHSLLSSRDGSASVEFVVIFLAFISIIFFVVEVTLYMFFMASLEKAAEAGVRAAVVSNPVVNIRTVNNPIGSIAEGTKCTPTTCERFPARSCNGNCSGAAFNRVLAHMQGFNGQIKRENVSITYTDTGIGFAGGPSAPMVTVRVSGIPFQTGILALLLDLATANQLATMPAQSASMTGEDLAQ